MNAPARINLADMTPVADVNLTAIFEREGIRKIEKLSCYYAVCLFDGRVGSGLSIGEALAKAKAPDAMNIKRVQAA